MARREGLSQWTTIVSTHLPHLSKPQATVLALWSFGMVIAHSCGISAVAATLAELRGQPEATLRQRLREWCYDATDKRGANRQALEVSTCFAPLLQWVLHWWASGEQRLALALDATTLGQRFTVLVISVVYRGCAIPVAWKVVRATHKGAWKPHWTALLHHLHGSVPAGWTVIVLADRGLYARWLYQAITAGGWHPFLRINQHGTFRPQGAAVFRSLRTTAPQVGTAWRGAVTCFVTSESQLVCPLLAHWDASHSEPWLVVTDLPSDAAEVVWYGRRAGIECGFKDLKRGGWHWEQTKMTDPVRAERLWLAIAVATLWAVSVGGAADASPPASSFDRLPLTHIARQRATRRTRPRLLSCFGRGLIMILVALIDGRPLPRGQFIPAPWPSNPTHKPCEESERYAVADVVY